MDPSSVFKKAMDEVSGLGKHEQWQAFAKAALFVALAWIAKR